MRVFSHFARISTIAAVVSILAACGDKPAAQRAPLDAPFVTVAAEQLPIVNELPGRLESHRIAEIRARVAGIVQKRTFIEGSDVKAGKALFAIDPRTYQANRDSAKASLARAEANLVQVELKLKRFEPLVEINAISKQEFDDAVSAQKQGKADVAAAKANLTNATINLEYATVTTPISGRIGRAMVTEGALVGQNEPTLLATVQQIDPIYLNLTQSSTQLLQLRRALESGQLAGVSKSGIPVTIIMEDGSVYKHKGRLLFSDITVDATTGELSVRALVPNPEKMLLPGMFVRGKIEQAINENAITVPQQAVQRSPQGASVMVINKENKVEARPVKTGVTAGTNWVISEGLEPGDRVIVEALQKIKPGMPVTPVPWKATAPGAAKDAKADANSSNQESAQAEAPKAEAPTVEAPKAVPTKEGAPKAAAPPPEEAATIAMDPKMSESMKEAATAKSKQKQAQILHKQR